MVQSIDRDSIQDGQSSQNALGSVGPNDSPTLPVGVASTRKTVRFEGVSDEDEDEEVSDLDTAWNMPVSPVAPSPSSSSTSPPKLKVTMAFMRAYKAMRGPRDTEPSPLFACLASTREPNDGACCEQKEDDPFKLAGRDEIRLLNEVNDAIVGDGDEDFAKRRIRPFVRDSMDEDAGRKAVFYFEQPVATSIVFPREMATHQRSTDAGDDDEDSIITDHALDHAKMDKGWIKANGPCESDDEDSYVSDDDGDPADARISPAMFRALAAGCTLNDVDSLRHPILEAPSLRPLTPQDKILDVSRDTTHHNNVAPYCHRRQFDIHTGEELSPAYRVEPGPSSSTLWTPPGVTPERAGLYLLLLQEGQGEQQQPVRGSGMPALFQRMAPLDCRELRTRLYGGPQRKGSVTLAASSTSSSLSSESPLLPCSDEDDDADDDHGENESHRTITFTWSEVNEAVQNCTFDPTTVSLTAVGVNNSPRKSSAASSTHSGPGVGRVSTTTAYATEQALLKTFRDSWQAIQTGQAADARLVAANEAAQAAITAQARCLAAVEHQLELCRAAELARERQEVQAHYRQQCRVERTAAHKERRLLRRRQRIVRGINDHLRSLRTTVGETEARLARGRELQGVLTQRLRDGEARLDRLCRDHGVADVAALSEVLAEKLAQLGVAEED